LEGNSATLPAVQQELFYVGDVPYQMYVVRSTPVGIHVRPNALIFVHGNAHTGAVWENTPDNRDGWATYFLSQGFTTYVVDLPGHGRSPMPPDYATMGMDKAIAALQALLLRAGPSILVGHSMGANIATRVTGTATPEVRANITGVVLVAPSRVTELLTSPGPALIPETEVYRWPRDVAESLFTTSDTFPQEAIDQYMESLTAESAHAFNQARQPGAAPPAGGPDIFASIPAVVIRGDQDKAVAPETIQAYSDYFGIPAITLGSDWSLPGHGHLMMIELGNNEIAAHLLDWFAEHALA
jgi:pimeloyl-ACP methyl ester carboxylesterase